MLSVDSIFDEDVPDRLLLYHIANIVPFMHFLLISRELMTCPGDAITPSKSPVVELWRRARRTRSNDLVCPRDGQFQAAIATAPL